MYLWSSFGNEFLSQHVKYLLDLISYHIFKTPVLCVKHA